MSEIIFDTNMFYNLTELKNQTVDKQTLINIVDQNKCYLTSVTLIECIAAYQTDIESLKKIAEDATRFSSIVQIGYMPFDASNLERIGKAEKIEDINDIIIECNKIKIEKESEFIRFLAGSITTALSISGVLSRLDKNSDEAKRFKDFIRAYIEGNNEDFIQHFKKVLQKGYVLNNAAKQVKSDFDFDMELTNCFIYILAYAAQHNINIFDDNENEDEVAKAFATSIPKQNNMELKKALETVMKAINEHDVYKGKLIFQGYICEIIERLLFRGGKFELNDICDLIILLSLDHLPKSLFLTHDKRLYKYLNSINRAFHY